MTDEEMTEMFVRFSDFGCEHARGAALVTSPWGQADANLVFPFPDPPPGCGGKDVSPSPKVLKGPVQSWKEFVQKSDWSKAFA
jgi:hypothetical protein